MVSSHVSDNGPWFSFGEVTIPPARLLRIIYPIWGIMTIPHCFFSARFRPWDRDSPPLCLTNVVCGWIFLRSVYCTKKGFFREKTPLKMQKLCHCASFLSMPHFLLTDFYEIVGVRWGTSSLLVMVSPYPCRIPPSRLSCHIFYSTWCPLVLREAVIS